MMGAAAVFSIGVRNTESPALATSRRHRSQMPPRHGTYGRLKIIKPQATLWVSLDRPRAVVGRSTADSRGQPTGVDIALNDSHVSNPHAAFEFEQAGAGGGEWRCSVRDLRSSNGTIVDGTLLKPKTKGNKSLSGGGGSHERGVQLTSGVSTVEVWLNGANRVAPQLLTCNSKGSQAQLLALLTHNYLLAGTRRSRHGSHPIGLVLPSRLQRRRGPVSQRAHSHYNLLPRALRRIQSI